MLNRLDSAETFRKDGVLVVHCCYLKISVFKKYHIFSKLISEDLTLCKHGGFSQSRSHI